MQDAFVLRDLCQYSLGLSRNTVIRMQSMMRPDVRVKYKDGVYKSPICRARGLRHSTFDQFDSHKYYEFKIGKVSKLSVDIQACSPLSS